MNLKRLPILFGTFAFVFYQGLASLPSFSLHKTGASGDLPASTVVGEFYDLRNTDAVKVSSGGRFTMYLRQDGSLWAVGKNSNGRLGDGTSTGRSQPVVIVESGVADIAAGGAHSLFIKQDGSLWANGKNTNGQLGDGSTSQRTSPREIVGSGVVSIHPGANHTLFIKGDGSLWGMGLNLDGQLGDGTNTDRKNPVEIVASGVVQAAAGSTHSLFVKDDGSLWAMGNNEYGQHGDNTTTDKNTPVQVLASGVVSVAAGDAHSLFVKSDGTLWAMGDNFFGELGDGTKTEQYEPVQVATNVVSIDTGLNHSVFLKDDGSLWAMGKNDAAELGDGTLENRDTPVQVVPSNVMSFSTGNHHTTFLATNGAVWAAGDNSEGQYGDSSKKTGNSPEQITSGTTADNGITFSLVEGDRATGNSAFILSGNQLLTQQALDFEGVGSYSIRVKATNAQGLSVEKVFTVGSNSADEDVSAMDLILSNAVIEENLPAGELIGRLSMAGYVDVVGAATGSSHTIFIKADGSLWADGDNGYGQLGDGTTRDRTLPVQVLENGVVSVYASGFYSLFLKDDGSLWSMGYNGHGQLGEGSTTNRATPVQIVKSGVRDVSAGENHALIVMEDGSMWGMGYNGWGQLGDSSTSSKSLPVKVLDSGVKAVAAGQSHSLVLMEDGALRAMGYNGVGQLGDGTTTRRLAPELVVESGVVRIIAGKEHSLFIMHDGSLWTFGQNGNGQLGDRTRNGSLVPLKVVPSNVVDAVAGGTHSLFLMDDGSLWAMGYNNKGQLGDGTTSTYSRPKRIFTNGGIRGLSAYDNHTVYWTDDGSLWAMGNNNNRQLGDGTTTARSLPVQAITGSHAANNASFALVAGDGDNDNGLFTILGDKLQAAQPFDFETQSTFSIRIRGTAADRQGQSGEGVFTVKALDVPEGIVPSSITLDNGLILENEPAGTPVGNLNLPGFLGNAGLEAGGDQSFVLSSDGNLWGFGYNANGQLGVAPYSRAKSPVLVAKEVEAIATGSQHSLILKRDGSLWVTGQNNKGQLGDGTTNSSFAPKVIVRSGVTAVAAGTSHSLYVMDDGSLWGMGDNTYGQLGVDNGNTLSEPVKIAERGVVSVSAGGWHSLFLQTDGSLWGMGYNQYGQVGDGTNEDVPAPLKVMDSGVWKLMAAENHSLFLKRDGSLWGMGYNGWGQLGDGTTTNKLQPFQVVGSGVTAVHSYSNHTLFTKSDGSLWSYGYNGNGQLGDGTTSRQLRPRQITATGVVSVATGSNHSLALRADGTVWAFGHNNQGQVGDGTTDNRSKPVQITQIPRGAFSLVTGSGDTDNHRFTISGETLIATESFDFEEQSSFSIRVRGVTSAGDSFEGDIAIQVGDVDEELPVATIRTLSIPANLQSGNPVGNLGIDGLQDTTKIFAYSDHSLFLQTGGSLWGMGNNTSGQLGIGPFTTIKRPANLRKSKVLDVATCQRHTLILMEGGSLWAVGFNTNGQVGNGTNTNVYSPARIVGSGVVSIAAGAEHSLFVKNDGTLWAFGRNNYGQLGNGTTDREFSPIQVVDADVVACAAGGWHSMFRKTDGSLWVMGYNAQGQLGDGTTTNSPVPIKIFESGIVDMDGGDSQTVVQKDDGSLWAFGYNAWGQLGDGTTSRRTTPVELLDSGAATFATGQNHTLVVKTDGSLWATGYNGFGQLGDGSSTRKQSLVQIVDSGVTQVAAGDGHSLFIRNGSLWGIGRNNTGQLGDGDSSDHWVPSRLLLGDSANSASTFSFVAGEGDLDNDKFSISGGQLLAGDNFTYEAGASYSIRLKATGPDGLETEAILALKTADALPNNAPKGITLSNLSIDENEPFNTAVGTLSAIDPDSNDRHYFLLTESGIHPGNSSFGIVGNQLVATGPFDFETQSSYSVEIRTVDLQGKSVTETFEISVNDVRENLPPDDIELDNQTIAEFEPAGSAVGFLSAVDPNDVDSHTFELVSYSKYPHNAAFTIDSNVLRTTQSFVLDIHHAFLIRVKATDADGLSISKSFLIEVTGEPEPPNPFILDNQTVAENQPSGTVVGFFNLKDGGRSTTFEFVPGEGDSGNSLFQISGSQLSTNSGFDFESNALYSIRVKANNPGGHSEVRVFPIHISDLPDNLPPRDFDLYRPFRDVSPGIGDLLGVFFPVQDAGIVDVATGKVHALILREDGSVWAFGNNGNGRLGDGTSTNRSRPVQVVASGAVEIAAGSSHSLILKNDGSLWAFGYNAYGRLGDGSTSSRNTPREIVSSGVRKIFAGGGHSAFIKDDGSLWGMGRNNRGQLGLGNLDDQNSPVQIIGAGVVHAALGGAHSLFIKDDGSLWGMGYNEYGQLGDNSKANHSTPVEIASSGIQDVAAGASHSLFVNSGGVLFSMGDNYFGQLGDGTRVGRVAPTQIGTGVSRVDALTNNSLALMQDGSLWAFGNNRGGQLGDGSLEDNDQPVQLAKSGVVEFSTGEFFSLFLMDDHSLWAVGTNTNGVFGNGTSSNSYAPILVKEGVTPETSMTYSLQSGDRDDGNSLFTISGNSLEVATSGVDFGQGNSYNIRVRGMDSNGLSLEKVFEISLEGVSEDVAPADVLLGNQTIQENQPAGTVVGNLSLGGFLDVAKVSTGGTFTLFSKQDGSLWAMGKNSYGQFGDGTTAKNFLPDRVMTSGIKDFSAGGNHAMVIRTDGSLWAIGYNGNGQLGTGTTVSQPAPVKIVPSGVVRVSAGESHTMFVMEDGSLWGTGYNGWGQLGDGSTTQKLRPVRVVPSGVADVSVGENHTVMLGDDGSLWTMGYNGSGRLGDGTTSRRLRPKKIEESGVVAIVAGNEHTLFLKDDGSLWAFGRNNVGQLGDRSNTDSHVPIEIVASGVAQIAAGASHSMLLKDDGSFWAIGSNSNGQYGDGTTTSTNRPTRIVENSGIVQFSSYGNHAMFVKSDGSLWGMGNNNNTQLGDGTTSRQTTPIEIVAPSFASSNTSFALVSGDGDTDNGRFTINGNQLLSAESFDFESNQTFSIRVQGTAAGDPSEVGDKVFTIHVADIGEPLPPSQISLDVVASKGATGEGDLVGELTLDGFFGIPVVTAGSESSLFTQADGSLWVMGGNANGQLGVSPYSQITSPVQVFKSGIRSVASGSNHTLVLHNDGSLWAMGRNNHGQLGDGTTNDVPTPTQIMPSGVVSISTGQDHSLFSMVDGSVWAMGNNTYGQLGDGTKTKRLKPVKALDSGVVAVAAGSWHSLLLKEDGSLWAMGYNQYGALGNGTTTDESSPVLIVEEGVVSISAGENHSMFVMDDGSLWSMGYNGWGQLGDGTTSSRTSPGRIVKSGVVSASAGGNHSAIVRTDGSLWVVGYNANGQVGDGTNTRRLRPVKVVDSNVATAAAGGNHTVFIKSDGSVWSTGYNNKGQLGDSTTDGKDTPVQVAAGIALDFSLVDGDGGSSNHLFEVDGQFLRTTVDLSQVQQDQLGIRIKATTPDGNTVEKSLVIGSTQTEEAGPVDPTIYLDNLTLSPDHAAGQPVGNLGIPSSPGVASINAGNHFSTFLLDDGSGFVMGNNTSGELGVGPYTSISTPASFPHDGIVSMSSGDGHTLFLGEDGEVWASGSNNHGQLGDGTTTLRNAPVRILQVGVSKVSAGNGHSLILKEGGSLWAMGYNGDGRLGDGTTTKRSTPVLVVREGVVDITAGGTHSLFIMEDGSLWGMGENSSRQLGQDSTIHYSKPVQIVGSDVAQVSAGFHHTMFVKTDGSLWTLGYNAWGQLGIGSTSNQHEPQMIRGSGVTAISAGGYHSLFVEEDGSLWTMGYNAGGQLGDGTTTRRQSPVKVVDSGVVAVVGGENHSLFIKDDGSLWAMGQNNKGQLGDGSKDDRHEPTLIHEGRGSGAGVSFTLVEGAGDTHNSSFALSGNELSTSGSFTFEAGANYSIRIQATSASGVTKQARVWISSPVTEPNSAPQDIRLTRNVIDENLPAATLVGHIEVLDPDEGDSHTFALVGSQHFADNSLFSIDGNQLKTAQSLEFESRPSYLLCIQATDSAGDNVVKNVEVHVLDRLDGFTPASAPTDIALDNATIAENQPAGTLVGNLSVSDPDAGDTHTFSLPQNDSYPANAAFTIDGAQLQGRLPLDFETKPTLAILVRVTDSVGFIFEKEFTVQVTDQPENAAPTGITIDNPSVPENEPVGTTVGTLSAVDDDVADSHTFSLPQLSEYPYNGAFTIDGNKLKTAGVFDYESKESFDILMRVSDSAGAQFNQPLTIQVSDVLENNPPTGISLDNQSIEENQPQGTSVGVLSATDADRGDTFTFALLNDQDYPANLAFEIDGNVLKTKAVLDYEQTDLVTIKVGVQDAAGATFSREFEIHITDVPENSPPTNITLDNNSIQENQPAGTVVGNLAATDADIRDTHTFALVDANDYPANALFRIQGTKLQALQPFDYETKMNFIIQVGVQDVAGATFKKEFRIEVTDIDELPDDGKTYVTQDILQDTTWTPDHTYVLTQVIQVRNQATLTIEPGTRIEALPSELDKFNPGSLIVTPGSRLMAAGTRNAPILFTSVLDDGTLPQDAAGLWGGVAILGNARVNTVDGTEYLSEFPDNIDTTFGGDNDEDNSGILRYISIRHGGAFNEEGDGINGLTLAGVGSGTTIEYIETFANGDDGFEFLGGAPNTRYLISAFNQDDAFDTDRGFRGFHQFWFSIFDPNSGSRAAEMDGGPSSNVDGRPFAFPIVFNATFLGAGSDANQGVDIMKFVQNGGGIFANSIFAGFEEGVDVNPADIDEPQSQDTETRFDNSQLALFNNIFYDIGTSQSLPDVVEISSTDGRNGDLKSKFTTALIDNGNLFTDPMFAGISRQPGQALDPRPAAPAILTNLTSVPDTNAFLESTQYKGAFGRQNWAAGWSKLGQDYMGDHFVLTAINPTSETISAAGGTYALEIQAGPTTRWTTDGLPGWATSDIQVGTSSARFTFTIQANSTTASRSFTIDIAGRTHTLTQEGRVNQAPTSISLSNVQLNENEPAGTIVGILTATDPDPGDALTFFLPQNDNFPHNEFFSIDGDKLVTNQPFDFETLATYKVGVRVADSEGALFAQRFFINIQDVDERTSPTDIILDKQRIAENQPSGTLVGSFSIENASGTFQFVAGEGSDHNHLFSINGTDLTTFRPFDYESVNQYSIRVRATDPGVGSFEKSFTIRITDLEEGNLRASASQIGHGWWKIDWFGVFLPAEGTNWVYHLQLGWVYIPRQQTPDNVWFWHQEHGWFWTKDAIFPWLYSYKHSRIIYFDETTSLFHGLPD